MTDRTVSVVGLGKLGLPLAACLATKGFNTIGVDLDADKVDATNKGIPSIFEPGLEELLKSSHQRLSATQDIQEAVLGSEVTFIVVPTPSEPAGGFSLKYVLAACDSIGKALRSKDDFHLVVLTSTVMPGSTQDSVRSALEEASGKSCGTDFGLCYSPEFIALGTVIRDFLNPDFLLIGESDPVSGDTLESLYEQVCDNSPPVSRMSFVNAELAKLAVNTFVTTKITFANMLARICEQLPGAHVDTVTSALGLDSRIGPKYLKGAIGYGGPCFPRDSVALATLGTRIGAPVLLAEATHKANLEEVHRLADLVTSMLPPSGVAGVLGLAYKADTDVVEESQGLLLAQALAEREVSTVAYDPAALDATEHVLGDSIRYATSAAECAQESDVLVITTPWEEFKNISSQALARRSSPRVVVDCWRILDRQKYEHIVKYVPLGESIKIPGKE